MRKARTPHEGCGPSREGFRRRKVAGLARALLRVVIIAVLSTVAAEAAYAQDPSLNLTDPFAANASHKKGGAFGPGGGNMFGKVNAKLDRAQPMRLQGDQLIYDKSGNRVIARGNVEIYYNNYILTADEVVYDQGAGTLTAIGNVTVKEPQGNIVHADRYTLTDDFRDGFVQSLSILSQDKSTITADRAVRRGGNVTEFENGRFTPCQSDGNTPPLWCISAARIIHDQDAATLTYQDAYFEIFGQPVFYLPYFQSPDPSVKRKSGFLTPDYGHSSTLGYIVGLPYFYNLAPNADFTFTPEYMSQQGAFLKGEWRHRLANGQYNVTIAGIEQDSNDLPGDPAANKKYDGLRGSIETHGLFSLSSWWKFGWDAIIESDDQFRRFYKLDPLLVVDRVNQVYLTGESDRNYFSAKLYQFGGLLVNDTPQTESWTHPIIDYNYVFNDPVLGGELKWDTNVLSFTRDDGATSPTGLRTENINRLVTELKWRRRLTDTFGITYTPFADVRGDIYQFDNFTDPTSFTIDPITGRGIPGTSQLVGSDNVTRGLFDAGATVSYPWVANTPGASHIIEPIGQIVVHEQSVTQRSLPDEDAQSLVFDDTNLFDPSKFSGYDRTETGTRANYGLQYTFQADDGGYARFLAGQSYHLSGDNIYANPGFTDDGTYLYSPVSGLQTDRSDYVLGAYLAPADSFRLISQSRFDQSSFAVRREDAAVNVNYGPLSGTAGYSFEYDAINPTTGTVAPQQEALGSVTVKLTDAWSVGGTARYDIDANQLLYDNVLVRYSNECLALTASYSDSYFNDATIENDHTVMLRLEFKHLGDFQAKDKLDYAFGGDQRTY